MPPPGGRPRAQDPARCRGHPRSPPQCAGTHPCIGARTPRSPIVGYPHPFNAQPRRAIYPGGISVLGFPRNVETSGGRGPAGLGKQASPRRHPAPGQPRTRPSMTQNGHYVTTPEPWPWTGVNREEHVAGACTLPFGAGRDRPRLGCRLLLHAVGIPRQPTDRITLSDRAVRGERAASRLICAADGWIPARTWTVQILVFGVPSGQPGMSERGACGARGRANGNEPRRCGLRGWWRRLIGPRPRR